MHRHSSAELASTLLWPSPLRWAACPGHRELSPADGTGLRGTRRSPGCLLSPLAATQDPTALSAGARPPCTPALHAMETPSVTDHQSSSPRRLPACTPGSLSLRLGASVMGDGGIQCSGRPVHLHGHSETLGRNT